MRLTKLFLLVIIPLCSCKSGKITGYYSSNFPIAGFFGTQLQLKIDSSYIYQYGGDLTNICFKGKYVTMNDTIYLLYDTTAKDTALLDKTDEELDTVLVRKFHSKADNRLSDSTAKDPALLNYLVSELNGRSIRKFHPKSKLDGAIKMLHRGFKLLVINDSTGKTQMVSDKDDKLRKYVLVKRKNMVFKRW